MTLPTVGGLLPRAADYLGTRGVRSPRLDAEHLLAHALGLTRLDLYLALDRPLEPLEVDAFRDLVRRRGRREPLAYVLGSWGFRGLDLRTDARALVPRPETEVLVERALALVADRAAPAVVDVGTGTGAIALSVAKERPDAQVTAIDVSADALALTAENAGRNGLRERLELLAGNLLEPVAGRRFDLVVANLPYVGHGEPVDPEVAEYEPAEAVYAGADGRALLDRLAEQLPPCLRPGAGVALEVGLGQAEWLAGRLGRAGLVEIAVAGDLAGVDRVVLARAPAASA